MRRYAVRWAALALLVAALAFAGCRAAYVTALAAHAYLNGVAALSASDAWAVGDVGTILHYSHGRWSAVPSPTAADLYGVAFASPNDGWAVGLDVAKGGGVILHYSAGKWSLVHGLDVPGLRGIDVLSASDVWVVGDGGTILHLSGAHWHAVPSATSTNLYSIAMISPSEGWAVGYVTHNLSNGGIDVGDIVHYHNGVWTNMVPSNSTDPVSNPYAYVRLLGVAVSANGKAWAVGTSPSPRGLVLQHSGSAWGLDAGQGEYSMQAVVVVTPGAGWAVGQNGIILHYDGASWSAQPRLTTNDLGGVAMYAPGEGWAVGDNNTILRAHNGVWRVVRH